jgi:hypothetical protein
MTEKFKVPKPRIYTGDNGDRKASAIDAWIQKLKDYLKLSGIQDNENKVLVMQYFLGGTAEVFYHTKRLANRTTTIDFEQFITDLRDHIVPSTDVNRHWEDWYKIHQVRNGRVDRINTTAIRMEKVAARLGEEISNTVKIQRFLDAMHPELRYAVELDIPNRSKAVWDDIKKLAERKDAALFQAGRYGRSQPSGQRYNQQSSNANAPQWRNSSNANAPQWRSSSNANAPQWRNTPQWGNSYSSNANAPQWRPSNNGAPGRGNSGKSSFKRLTDNEKAQLRKDRKCFYCKKPGHIFNDCRARQRNQQNGKFVQSAHTSVNLLKENLTETVEEFIESARTIDNREKVNNMVTNMNINDQQARVLLDTGTTGTNLMSSSWAAQTHNVTTKELPTPITIHMAAKGSKTNANRFAWAPVEIKPENLGKERTKFLIVAVSSYDVIVGMPFLQEHHVVLNTVDSSAYFPKHDVTIQCATKQAKTLATSSATEEIPPFDKMFPKLFPEKEPEGLPPLREGCNHIIRIDDEKLKDFHFTPRRIPDAYRPDLVQHLGNWQRNGIANAGPGITPAAMFGTPKIPPSKGWRWVNDLRDRNKITLRDYTPIPSTDVIREDAARANYISLLDLSNAYHQIRVDPGCEKYNVINAGDLGSFKIRVMLQGDCNAPATMMRVMNTILGEFIGRFVWVYLDDILIYSTTYDEHIDHLSRVFHKLEEA